MSECLIVNLHFSGTMTIGARLERCMMCDYPCRCSSLQSRPWKLQPSAWAARSSESWRALVGSQWQLHLRHSGESTFWLKPVLYHVLTCLRSNKSVRTSSCKLTFVIPCDQARVSVGTVSLMLASDMEDTVTPILYMCTCI